jgi:hypothetical protein
MAQIFTQFPPQIYLAALLFLIFIASVLHSYRPQWTAYLLATVITLYLGFTVFFFFPYFKVPPNNYSHYYLGAKYKIDYFDFYTVLKAARGEPLEDFMNLRGDYSAGNLVNGTPIAKRNYYIWLLERFNVPFNPGEGIGALRKRCEENGLFNKHASIILGEEGFKEPQVSELKKDAGYVYINFKDKGFNGSPFYVLLRQVDPAVHLPLTINSFRWSTALELILLAFSGLALSRALGWDRPQLLVFYALTVTSWEFVGWNLLGLVAMAWFLPACLSLYLFTRGRFGAAGAATAIAALLKIFPLILAVPVFISAALKIAEKRSPWASTQEMRYMGSLALTVLLLGGASQAYGADWMEWVQKIKLQFASGALVSNNVSLYGTWNMWKAGPSIITDVALWLGRFSFVALVIYIARKGNDRETLIRGGVAALSLLPWMIPEFLNYYTMGHTVVMTIFFNERRKLFYLLMGLLLVNQVMISYTDDYIMGLSGLIWLKNGYFLVLPWLFFWVQFHKNLEKGERGERSKP